MWFPLKKKRDDSKYRGEVNLQFTFSYEKPTLSISNTSLNKIEKGKFLSLCFPKRVFFHCSAGRVIT
ncbi:hypothetical protein COOONC_25178 [Cooperia oncophora]